MSTFDTNDLDFYELRGLDLIEELSSVPRLNTLQQNVEEFLSSILSTKESIGRDPRLIENTSVEQEDKVRTILKTCATCVTQLRLVCLDLYRDSRQVGWDLDNKEADRAFVLDVATKPFDGICDILSYLTYILPCWSDGERAGQERPEAWDDWFKAACDNVIELKLQIKIAGELAMISLSASRLYQRENSLDIAPSTNGSDIPNSDELKGISDSSDDGVWQRLRRDLAENGILDDAIEKIEDPLKDFVRNLVQGETSHWEQPDQDTTTDNPKLGSYTNDEASGRFEASGNLLNAVDKFQKVRAGIAEMLPGNYDSIAPEILEVALQSTNAFRQVLRILYDSACRDPGRAAIYARFAKYLQKHSTTEILKSSPTCWGVQAESGKGPVSGYLWKRCWGDWKLENNGSTQITVEHFALGLSSFIGELVKYKMVKKYQVNSLLQRLLESNSSIKTAEAVALYQLLRTVGSTIEGGRRTPEMSGHFERLNARINSPGVPKNLRTLGKELKEMRKSGWTAVKTRAESEALCRAVVRIRDDLSRSTKYASHVLTRRTLL
ncbi:hypothetical protein VMCG_08018 [Cytospora schulzeri]|uniref:MIF4G domain-containing protein n=1 Tax=Cytospora schulzeri TaxID=448051 RepID=A0A423VY49_9PEZI|nr:hypothetical protein VMCG_08018 [Valsa malicola]